MEAKIEFDGGWVVMSLRDWEQHTAVDKMVREGLEEKCRKLEAAGKAVPVETVRETVPKKLVEHVVRAHKKLCPIVHEMEVPEELQYWLWPNDAPASPEAEELHYAERKLVDAMAIVRAYREHAEQRAKGVPS